MIRNREETLKSGSRSTSISYYHGIQAAGLRLRRCKASNLVSLFVISPDISRLRISGRFFEASAHCELYISPFTPYIFVFIL